MFKPANDNLIRTIGLWWLMGMRKLILRQENLENKRAEWLIRYNHATTCSLTLLQMQDVVKHNVWFETGLKYCKLTTGFIERHSN